MQQPYFTTPPVHAYNTKHRGVTSQILTLNSSGRGTPLQSRSLGTRVIRSSSGPSFHLGSTTSRLCTSLKETPISDTPAIGEIFTLSGKLEVKPGCTLDCNVYDDTRDNGIHKPGGHISCSVGERSMWTDSIPPFSCLSKSMVEQYMMWVGTPRFGSSLLSRHCFLGNILERLHPYAIGTNVTHFSVRGAALHAG